MASADNPVADALTRQDMCDFLRAHPQHPAVPDRDLPELLRPGQASGWKSELIALFYKKS